MLRGKATESTFDTGGTLLVGQPPGVDGMWGGVGTQSQENIEQKSRPFELRGSLVGARAGMGWVVVRWDGRRCGGAVLRA